MSIETATEVGVATFESIVEAMDFTIACEHHAHEAEPQFHDGDAEWVATQRCACKPVTALVCTKFVKAVKAVPAERLLCHCCATPTNYDLVKL